MKQVLHTIFLAMTVACGLSAPLFAADRSTAAPVADDITPENSNDFFGNLDEQNAKTAQENDAIFTRGRMAFLFGYYDIARELWLPLANDGYAKAQANIAWMYQTGKGLEKDLKKAVEWYLKAAKQGHAIAQNNLGVMHENAWGTKKNLQRATYWYREAASIGYSYGQYNYGKMLLDGAGVDKNPKEAAYWLGLAALQGVDDAKGLLINKTKWGTDQPGNSESHNPTGNSPQPKQQQPVKEVLREAWVLRQPAKSYTLQLLSSKEEHVVNEYLSNPSIPEPIAYYKANVLGEDWYSVVYGVFPTFNAAQQHMRMLPSGLLRYKPWIRAFADVQQSIKAPVE